ncbi:hypothetical protein BRARA_H01356 [Brassica rapa]|uniref:Uncharacterized protein n=1 Tax=Brassica campestris TaxID=3711 RepID=A0A397YFM1_BRACM|nr:hypothetical protein BRARA_H01356 [Brassica rapa]
MQRRKRNANGEEKAKPLTAAGVTWSMDRRTRSATKQNGAKAAGSVTKLASPKKVKRKKSEVETETESEKKTKKEEEEAETEDSTKRKSHTGEGRSGRSCSWRTVTLNPENPRRGCFEIREEGGQTFITLLEMKRPFAPMKALDMEEVIEDIINKIK